MEIVDEILKELATATDEVQSYRPDKPFTLLEQALGLLAFAQWLIVGLNRNDPDYFRWANSSAREIAIVFAKETLAEPEITCQIQKQIPSFNLDQELVWAMQKAKHEDWLQCLTRAIIMYCRALAYRSTSGEPSILHEPAVLLKVGTALFQTALQVRVVTNPEMEQTYLAMSLEEPIATVSKLDEFINLEAILIGSADGRSGLSAEMQALYELYGTATQTMLSGDLKCAIEIFEKIIKEYPDFVAPRVNIAHALRQACQPREALRHLGEAHKLAPNDPSIHLEAGLVCEALGDKDREIRHYHEALEDDPTNITAMNNLGAAYREIGKTTRSKKWLLEAIKTAEKLQVKSSEKSRYIYNLALTYEATENWAKAIECWEICVKLKPDEILFQERRQEAIAKNRRSKGLLGFLKR